MWQPLPLPAGRLFCWRLRRRVTCLRSRTSFAGHRRKLPQEVWLPPSPPTFGGLICPWAEERHSGLPPGPADVLQARPRLPRSRLQFSFILVRRTETLLVDLALEALKGNLGV